MPEPADRVDEIDPLGEPEDDLGAWPAQSGGLGAIGQLLAALLGVVVLGVILLAAAAALGWLFR